MTPTSLAPAVAPSGAARADRLAALDRAALFHPFTNLARHAERGPLVITHGEGVHVFDAQGRRYLEGMSGLWCATLGFSEKRLVEAARAQLDRLPFYHGFHHRTPDVAIELAAKLTAIAPAGLTRAFFANSGSEANDTAVKLIRYYNNAIGRPRKKKIVTRKNAYHGTTALSASLDGFASLHQGFDLPECPVAETACPHHYRFAAEGETPGQFGLRLADELDALIRREGADTVAAFFCEPVMGVGGVIVPPETYVPAVQAVLAKHDVLLVADEVITGFGRTGRMFGSETMGMRPDILTMAKGLSGAYVPISAVMVTEPIYQAIAAESGRQGGFGHGFTYSGHPVACAVALEAIAITEERDIPGRVRALSPRLLDGLHRFADHPLVGEVRGIGLMSAVELVADKETKASFAPAAGIGAHLVDRALAYGAIIRAVGDTIILAPPLIIAEAEIDTLLDIFRRALDDAAIHAQRPS